MTPAIHIANLADQVVIPDHGTLSRTIDQDEQIKVVLFGFSPGEGLSEHTAAMPAILHFIQGTARVTFGDEVVEAGPGTWIHMPAHMPHSISTHTPVVMLLLLLRGGR